MTWKRLLPTNKDVSKVYRLIKKGKIRYMVDNNHYIYDEDEVNGYTKPDPPIQNDIVDREVDTYRQWFIMATYVINDVQIMRLCDADTRKRYYLFSVYDKSKSPRQNQMNAIDNCQVVDDTYFIKTPKFKG